MALTTPNMLALIDARFKEIFFESQGNVPIISDRVVRTKPTTRRYEIVTGIVGVPEAGEVAEGGMYPSKELKIRPNTFIEMKKFGFKMNISRELIEDNLFQPLQDDVARSMRNSMTQTKERRAINLINNGWTTQLVYDGQTLFSTLHVLIQGGTQSNRSAAPGALDVDTLWEAINTMMTTKDNSTLYTSIYMPKYICGHQQLQRKMNELIRSEWVPYAAAANADNRENVMRALYALTPLVSPLFSSTTAWSLYADPAQVIDYGLVHYTREALSLQTLFNIQGNTELGVGVDRDFYTWRCRERYEMATINWLGTYGNLGS